MKHIIYGAAVTILIDNNQITNTDITLVKYDIFEAHSLENSQKKFRRIISSTIAKHLDVSRSSISKVWMC